MTADERKAKRRAYYRAHAPALKASVKKCQQKWALFARSQKNGPCVDCGLAYPPHVLQFDHVRGPKLFQIADCARSGKSEERILAEIAKCDLVCANCHAERTYKRRSHRWPVKAHL